MGTKLKTYLNTHKFFDKMYFHFQYLLLLVLLSMIGCTVYQVLISLLKTIILLCALAGYIIIYVTFNKELQLLYRNNDK